MGDLTKYACLVYRIVSQLRDPAKAYGVRTNPKKSEEVVFAAEDKVIVLAEN
jgi:hypothetical protein